MQYRIWLDNKNQYYWVLYAANGEPIARSSESYVRRADCEHCILLTKSSYNAPVVS